ncbi:hypothetical protein E2493_02640 [Sphingomonas parva]|uniref:Uncharacterized protein n=1 Tax=Sphingomonas parva TaxID=2555898 RepID=A0A4Y8ZX25_9SPHN|nr:hypothetical protein [Sphingomonas parva]TFI59755.1 hypothetical protein E2493_02640 [Sphingomonas parva]
MGVILRPPSDPAGALGVRVQGAGLEIGVIGDGYAMVSCRDKLRIDLRTQIPDTIRLSLVGRPVSRVIGHDLLKPIHYTILRATTTASGATLFVHTGRSPYDMPWPQLARFT